jgi:signal transduction histidine kinase
VNLLANAVKFTPDGGEIDLVVSKDHDHLGIEVKDTGIGMSADFLPYAFDRFRQADSSTTREYGGLGLGLALVKQIAEAHHGTVAANSAGLGLGTTMTVRLPIVAATH